MFAFIVLLAVLGGLDFAVHVLWYVLIFAVLLWVVGFFVGGVDSGIGWRRWYGSW